MITQQTVHDSGFIQSDHPAYSNGLTPSNYCLFQNLESYLRGVHYAWHYMMWVALCWRCESFPFNGLRCHGLQWHRIRNKLICFIENVHSTDIRLWRFFSLIHWFSLLIEYLSYVTIQTSSSDSLTTSAILLDNKNSLIEISHLQFLGLFFRTQRALDIKIGSCYKNFYTSP